MQDLPIPAWMPRAPAAVRAAARACPVSPVLVWLLVLAPWAQPSQSAPSPQPVDLAAPGTPPSSSLDRALRVDTNAGQRNLELLLESRNADEGMAIPAERRAPTGPSAGANAGASSGEPAGEPAKGPSWLNSPGAVAPAGATVGPVAPAPQAAERPAPVVLPGLADVRPGLLPVPQAGGGRPAQAADGPPVQTAAQRDLEAALRNPVIRETLLYLRANRDWLLGALAAVLVLVVLVQAAVRRLFRTPQARAAAAARAQAVAPLPFESRRSSRRGERSHASSGDSRLALDGEHRRRRRRSSRRD